MQTFTEVWDGAKPDVIPIPGDGSFQGSYGITDVGLDPINPNVVYAAGFDAGLWRRDAGAAATAFNKVVRRAVQPGARHRPADVRHDCEERAHPDVPDRGNSPQRERHDRSLQLLAQRRRRDLLAPRCTAPDPATHAFPATYNGWQCLTSDPTTVLHARQCWYDQNVYTPAGHPDTVYVIGWMSYGEQPCNTNGVGCGNGRSNGRAVIYSNTAGDPTPRATCGRSAT